MKNCNKRDLIISIENSIAFVGPNLDSTDKTIAFVFKKAYLITLQDLFHKMYAIEADIQ